MSIWVRVCKRGIFRITRRHLSAPLLIFQICMFYSSCHTYWRYFVLFFHPLPVWIHVFPLTWELKYSFFLGLLPVSLLNACMYRKMQTMLSEMVVLLWWICSSGSAKHLLHLLMASWAQKWGFHRWNWRYSICRPVYSVQFGLMIQNLVPFCFCLFNVWKLGPCT